MFKIIKSYLKSHRRIVMLLSPVVLADFGILVTSSLYIFSREKIFLIILWVLLMVSIVAFVNYIYIYKLTIKLAHENIDRGCNTYLNGFQVWLYEGNGAFSRLGYYIGHGICYSISALLMLVWEDYKKTRYVFCKSYDLGRKKWIRHAWIEVKAYGIWWVIDPTWRYPVFPSPRWLYKINFLVKYERIISHDEFFSHPVAREIATGIKDPKTSYYFHDLSLFSSYTDCPNKMLLEICDIKETMTKGLRVNPLLLSIYAKGRPVTQKILQQYVLKENRLMPKMRSFRRAQAIEKLIERKLASSS